MNLMSAYGKAPPSQIHGNGRLLQRTCCGNELTVGSGYDSDRSFSEGTYAFPPPIYGQVSSHTSASSPSFPEAASMAQIPYSSSQPRASYEDPTGPYLSVGSTPTPVIKTYAPQRGTGGMKMQVAISTIYELLTSSEPVFSLSFGHTKVPASFTKTNQQGSICEYSVDAEIPQFAVTGWPTVSLPVSMYMESGDGDVIAKLDVGEFTYGDASSNNFQEPQRKRKYSNDSTDIESSAKRLASQQIRPKDDFTQYTSYAPNPSNYMAYPGTTTMPSTTYGAVPQYNRQGIYQPQRGMGTYANPGAASGMRTQPGSWGTSYPPLTSMRSPGVPSNSGLSRSLPSPGASANPPLVRTTCLQQTPSPANTPHGLVPQYNTYPLYPNRAQLEIEGDLDSMTCRWSAEEWEASRRLVLFTRSQSGSTITTKFKPVSADEKHHNGIVISCIMWPEKKECFVTSVEIISLLEVLVTGRFTVEEKNRIRRNLEGYRPLTVSKGKDDSASFFKTIMDFPLPKPRNIEKDIKVFYWKDLTVALKKIIGKYVRCSILVFQIC